MTKEMLKLDVDKKSIDANLHLDYRGLGITASKHLLGSTDLFRITFGDNRKPLVITMAKKESGRDFWTSIPEGRQREAEEIGDLITNHFKLF